MPLTFPDQASSLAWLVGDLGKGPSRLKVPLSTIREVSDWPWGRGEMRTEVVGLELREGESPFSSGPVSVRSGPS